MFRFCRQMIRFRKPHTRLPGPTFGAKTSVGTASSGPSTCRAIRTPWPFACTEPAYDDDDLYVMINAGPTDANFGIHEGPVGSWHRAIDTAQPSPARYFGARPGSGRAVGLLSGAGPQRRRAAGQSRPAGGGQNGKRVNGSNEYGCSPRRVPSATSALKHFRIYETRATSDGNVISSQPCLDSTRKEAPPSGSPAEAERSIGGRVGSPFPPDRP